MKIYATFICACALGFAGTVFAQAAPEAVEAPARYRRPEGFKPRRHAPALAELSKEHSEGMMERSKRAMEALEAANASGKWKPTAESIDSHRAPEWFLDAKFGLFIDWGLWSVAGWAPKNAEGALYPDWYEAHMYGHPAYIQYHRKNWGEDFQRDDFIPLFTAEAFDPAAFADFAEKVGAKYVVPFGKHHSGFALWPSSYTFRDASDMGPKRDLLGPLAEACRKRGMKFGMYFSIDEWEYPLLKGDGSIEMRRWAFGSAPYSPEMERMNSGKIAVRDFIDDYILPQAMEMIGLLSPDILWLDGEWDAPASRYRSYDLAAYYYNVNEGKKEVAVNDRFGRDPENRLLRTVRGDFYTCEYGDTAANLSMEKYHPWEACRGISQSFGFNWQDSDENVISSRGLVELLCDTVSRGGNLLLLVNLDGRGALPEVQKARLEDLGGWLAINGEAIFATRPVAPFADASAWYTRSKDGRFVYAVLKTAPEGGRVRIAAAPKPGSKISVLGGGEAEWEYADAEKPESGAIVDASKLPRISGGLPVAFRIEVK